MAERENSSPPSLRFTISSATSGLRTLNTDVSMKIFIQEKPCFIYPRRYPFQVGGEFLHCKTQFLCVASRGTRLSERDLSVRLVEDHGVARLNSSLLREFLGNRDLKLLRNLVLLQSNTSLLQGNLRVSNCPRLLPNKSPARGRNG